MTRDEEIGANIARLRADAGLRQVDLVERVRRWDVKWTAPSIVDIERGRRALKVRELEAVADVLGVPVAFILGRGSVTSQRVERDRLFRRAWDARMEAHNALVRFERARRDLAIALDEDGQGALDDEARAFLSDAWAWSSVDLADHVMGQLADELTRRPDHIGAVMTAYLSDWVRQREDWEREDAKLAAPQQTRKGNDDGR